MENMPGAPDSAHTPAGAPSADHTPASGPLAAPTATEHTQAASGASDAGTAPIVTLTSSDVLDRAIDLVVAEQGTGAVENATLGDGLDPGEHQPVVPDFDIDHPRIIEPIPILINGEQHLLRLPLRSIRAFQRKTGFSIWDSEKVWAFPPDPDMLMNLLWAALLWKWPTVTTDEMEDWDLFEFGNIHYLRRCLNRCWGENQPQPEPEGATNGTHGGTPPNGRGRLPAATSGG